MAEDDTRKLFVAGLSERVTEATLRSLCEEVGATVVECAVPRDRQTGAGRGFGFVTLSSGDEADQVRQQLDGTLHEGRPISVRPFRGNRGQSRPPRQHDSSAPSDRVERVGDREEKDNTLFIAGLPHECTQQEITDAFQEVGAGPLVKLHLPVDGEGRRRGFGFATLPDAAAARSAVEKLRNLTLHGRSVTVEVARPRGERPERGAERGPGGPAGGGAWRSRPSGGGVRREGEGAPLSSGGAHRGFGGMVDPDAGAHVERQTWDERRGGGPGGPGGRKRKEAKKKKERSSSDRGRSRRDGEGFRSPRSRQFMRDWDDD